MKLVKENMKEIISILVKINYDQGSCGLRFMVKPYSEDLLKDTVLLKSHYVIYEKEIK